MKPACCEEPTTAIKNTQKLYKEKLEGRDNLGGLKVEGRIILK
jgi:hypothetical protein